tara:strand:+ start:16303 stop:16566 length:264 start_codon:yes stop_codon:yes gene_type:complete
MLEDIGCAIIMPLGSPIGLDQSIKSFYNIQIIKENSNIPVIVDVKTPFIMVKAIKTAIQIGRLTYLSGTMVITKYANLSFLTTALPF